MSVSELLSPLPKNWSNINVNSVNVGDGGISSQSQPYLQVRLGTPKVIANNVPVVVNGMTNVRSVGNLSYNSTSGILTIPTKGVYNISYSAVWDDFGANTAINAFVSVSNDVNIYAYSACAALTDAANTGALSLYLPDNSSITLSVLQKSGANANLASGYLIVYKQS